MNEQDFANKVSQALDETLDRLPAHVTRRLAGARAAALTRAEERASVVSTHSSGRTIQLGWLRSPRIIAPILGLVLGIIGVLYFEQTQRLQQNYAENAELDAQMLSDELPVAAYLDQGFEIWLYHQTPASSRR
ncbi:MAG TPA: DUF3619 family protein [Burkholderiales bacterium]|nr:DUF3619 family protein [Burkholderiales bacterium]